VTCSKDKKRTQSRHGPQKKKKQTNKQKRVEIAIFRSYFPCMLPIYFGFLKKF